MAGNIFDPKPSQQCIPAIPAKPDKNILKVLVNEQKPEIKEAKAKKWGANFTYAGPSETSGKIAETDYNFEYMGRPIGVFKTVSIERMPIFPFFIFGCGLNDAGPSWECGAMIYRQRQMIDTFPDTTLRDAYGADPVRAMLQIERYTDTDFSDFKGFPESIAYIDSMIARKKNETSADFNEWGMKKDSPYLPVISTFNGVASYKGVIYPRKEGGPFYAFIEGNHGKIVYIDATVDGNANANGSGIGIYGVCPDEQSCMYNHYYDFKSSNGSVYEISKTMSRTGNNVEVTRTVQIKGYWSVGNTLPEGHNTRTVLIGAAVP